RFTGNHADAAGQMREADAVAGLVALRSAGTGAEKRLCPDLRQELFISKKSHAPIHNLHAQSCYAGNSANASSASSCVADNSTPREAASCVMKNSSPARIRRPLIIPAPFQTNRTRGDGS